MKIPYVIDNQEHRLLDVLRRLLQDHAGRSLDIATAYFTVSAFGMLREGLSSLGNFRLLLGAEPAGTEQIGLRPRVRAALGADLSAEPFTESTLQMVEDFIRFLRRDRVGVRLYEGGFLHAKCYLFYNDRPEHGWDRFRPIAGIVGSSNFTAPGLTTNKELNLTHKAVLSRHEVLDDVLDSPATDEETNRGERADFEERQRLKSTVGARAIAELDGWFERQWREARDFKDDLIELLDTSKFGSHEYTLPLVRPIRRISVSLSRNVRKSVCRSPRSCRLSRAFRRWFPLYNEPPAAGALPQPGFLQPHPVQVLARIEV